MKDIRCLLIFTILLIAGCKETDPRWVMWYDEPADEFIEALVIGNGQMGATVYGGTDEELIQINPTEFNGVFIFTNFQIFNCIFAAVDIL